MRRVDIAAGLTATYIGTEPTPMFGLTDRERQVFRLQVRGQTNSEISKALLKQQDR